MNQDVSEPMRPSLSSWVLVAIAWTLVVVPLGWALIKTLQKSAILFR